MLHPDRLLPAEPHIRGLARTIYHSVRELPIISPHGHTDPAWFASNEPFTNPVSLFITPDHYVFRMLYSQGIGLSDLGIVAEGEENKRDPRDIWRLFAENYHLFRGTPTRIWLDHVFSEVFELSEPLSLATAEHYFDAISDALDRPDYRPRALFERFNIEVLATTESPIDSLPHHDTLATSGCPSGAINLTAVFT